MALFLLLIALIYKFLLKNQLVIIRGDKPL